MNESAQFTALFRALLAAVDERLARQAQLYGMRGSTIDASFIRGVLSSDTVSSPTHQSTHQAGGTDALTGNLNATARVAVRIDGGADVGPRRRLNLILGPNVTIA